MRVIKGPAGSLISTNDPELPVPELLAELLEAVARCDRTARPFFYEVGPSNATLRGEVPIGAPIRFADGTARHGQVSRGEVSSTPPTAGDAPPERVRMLIETAGVPGVRCFLDPLAVSVNAVTGTEEDQQALAREMLDLASRAGVRTARFDSGRIGSAHGDDRGPFAAFAALRSDLGGAEDTQPVLFVVDARSMRAELSELLELGHARAELTILLLNAPASPAFVLLAGSPAVAYLRAPDSGSVALGQEIRSALEIGVLGPTEIRGGDGSLVGRPRLSELVVYLAMHPGGVSTKTWSAALWPERRVPPQTVANRLSEARGLLGFAADGRPRLRRTGERHFVSEVDTDWSRFVRLAASRSPADWRAALGLVRGRPFGDLAEGSWTVLEGFVGEIEAAVVDCALRLGEHCLSNGDPDGASFAAQMAVRASPWDERLHRLLMRAADAAGNRSGVEEILRHLALLLEVDGDPLLGVHPETAALYGQLSGRSPSSRH